HSYSPDEKKYKGYDWIKPEQISWFLETHQQLEASHKSYTLHHLDMAFIHIPLPEFREVKPGDIRGKWLEASTAPMFNSHFRDALVKTGIGVVSCGHDHVNDYCALDRRNNTPNLWMCYGGGSGFGGYV